MSLNLQQADVNRLMAQPSAHMRAVVAGKLAREIDNPTLTPTELQMAQDIVRLLAQDVQMMVRVALAHNLRRSKHLPHDVALRLANDVEAVALPILLDSEILKDEDLLAFVRGNSVVKQKAVASRAGLSETVINEIIATGSEPVVAALMDNKSAPIGDWGFHKAIDRFNESDLVKESMVKRPRLPVAVAERLVVIVSTQLKNYLIQNHQLPPAMAAEFAQQSHERSVIQLSNAQNIDDIERLAAQMHEKQRLTPTLIVRALCMGNVAFFEFGLAALSGTLVVNARALIHDAGGAGLLSLWEKAAMPAWLLPLARTALDILRRMKLDGEEQDIQRFRARLIERILTQMGSASQDEADYLMDLLQ